MLFVFSCNKTDSNSISKIAKKESIISSTDSSNKTNPKVTFVELGSVSCIPCKMMQPVMEAIEEEFGNQIEVVFHDVWKDPEPGRKYGIKLIPTQIFLDSNEVEFFRHEGFFPKENIEKLLVEKGLKILKQVEIKK
ncbi:thioredoxin family protein [candidate division KSB1 bacterium]|nr:thioredoxin family protein [candidate division KSB1 bacterium]MBL7092488.1 thioredoxin family protein [candidate division KSB1 bacterium]